MKVEYITHSGDDLMVANAARVSFDKQSTWELTGYTEIPEYEINHRFVSPTYQLRDRDARLIHYLARHNHWTPFSHPQITLRETVPIFVARQRFKHGVGFTYNEISRRYVDEEPRFYVPADGEWRTRADNVKQGSSDTTVPINPRLINDYYDTVKFIYEKLLAQGVAPELARSVLPQSMYTSYYVTGSLAAFARAYKLRSSPDAQWEIRQLANRWSEIISPLYPSSWSALLEASSSSPSSG